MTCNSSHRELFRENAEGGNFRLNETLDVITFLASVTEPLASEVKLRLAESFERERAHHHHHFI